MNFCPGELFLKLLARIGEWHQNLSEKTVSVTVGPMPRNWKIEIDTRILLILMKHPLPFAVSSHLSRLAYL